jgi:asparagine synthase (glutamine-hydrolysing)
MCGIVGMIRLDGGPVDESALQRMRDAMWHRGPDDAGVWWEGPVALGHRRLSILDLSPLGHQPMHAPDGSASIVFNGEIFNFIELKSSLRGRGQPFTSNSDTEVLLHLWQQQGVACLNGLVGMYGFAIWDRNQRQLFAARDRLGIKPFYYTQTATHWLFASEIKALLAHPEVARRLDASALADHLYCGYALDDRTLFHGIKSLPPGHYLTVSDGRVEVRPYWSVRYEYDRKRTLDETVEALRPLLDDAVRLHCRSDAPLGAHLSGGLDSSTVAALAASHRDSMPTFSIRYSDGGVYDESSYARAVADRIGSTHHEEFPEHIPFYTLAPLLTYHLDTPVSYSAIAYFGAARLARRYVTVALTGHGGDEVFGGYPAQFDVGLGMPGDATPNASGGFKAISARERLAFLWHSEGLPGLWSRVRRRAFEPPSGLSTAAQRWIAWHCALLEAKDSGALTSTFRSQLGNYSPRNAFLSAFDTAGTDQLFDRCLHHDLRSYLPSLLHVEDRTSMALSLESRVPLLDHRLVEFAATVPPSIKVAGNRSKQLVRLAMRGRLPDAVLDRRDKGAFTVPIHRMMTGDTGGFARRVLLEARTLDRGIYSPRYIRACVEHNQPLFHLLAIELWCRIHLDNDSDLVGQARDAGDRLRSEVGVQVAPR